MRFTILPTLLASTTSAAIVAHGLNGFFMMYSTTDLGLPQADPPIMQSAATVQSDVASILSSCPTSKYALVTLPNFVFPDIWECDHPEKCNIKSFVDIVSKATKNNREKPYMVMKVKGQVSSGAVADQIRSSCATDGKSIDVSGTVEVVNKAMDRLPVPVFDEYEGEGAKAKRDAVLRAADAELTTFISTLGDDYTVLIIADADDHEPYEPTFDNIALHTDIKRRTDSGRIVEQRADGNKTVVDHRGLFEKYQFFTPGIFMGLIALIVMFSILGVGLMALSSLEVSYGAFEKEMGPAAQKKNL